MTAEILNGKKLAKQRKQDIKNQVLAHVNEGSRPPSLAVILVGEDPASEVYVANKQRACREVGFTSELIRFPNTVTQQALLQKINELNQNDEVDGILVQLPLPSGIDQTTIISALSPAKDVDGFHPYNMGRLVLSNPLLRPCTPYGIMQMLTHYKIPLQGKHAVVVGASIIVGRPMMLELVMAQATVTLCHRFTQELEQHVRKADLIVVATGHRYVIDPDWLNDKQVLVDVGIHRLESGKVTGDVDFDKAAERVAWITPVPGGVGPMTVAALLENTLRAQHLRG